MTVPNRKRKQSTEPLILTKYETRDDLEYGADGEIENSKRWHMLTDQYGEVHYLEFSPYEPYKPKHIKAFKECARLLGRVPNGLDVGSKWSNLSGDDIFVLLEKLLLIKDIKSGDVY